MDKVTFFSTTEELLELTGIKSRDALWEFFDLDDWNYGFVTEENYLTIEPEEVREFNYWTGEDGTYTINHLCLSDDAPEWFCFWWNKAENYYCHVEVTQYGGKTYYMAYHA